jgi:hypothetical protein
VVQINPDANLTMGAHPSHDSLQDVSRFHRSRAYDDRRDTDDRGTRRSVGRSERKNHSFCLVVR